MRILIAGEGGQGVQAAAEILAYAAFLENKHSSLIPNFGVEQRGGVSLAFVVIGEESAYPRFDKADFLVILCDRAFERINSYTDPETKVLYGPAVTLKEGLKTDLPNRVWNIFMLSQLLKLSQAVARDTLERALKEKLADKLKNNPELEELNLKALNGYG